MGRVDQPEPLVRALSGLVAPGGVLSVLALNAQTSAVRPALQRRWADALAAFDAPRWERGELGVDTRGDTVDELSDLVRAHDVEPVAWYGVWLFSDGWVDLTGADQAELAELAAVELAASRRDPYRRLSRAFHLVGRKPS